jgi:hypothetical protein
MRHVNLPRSTHKHSILINWTVVPVNMINTYMFIYRCIENENTKRRYYRLFVKFGLLTVILAQCKNIIYIITGLHPQISICYVIKSTWFHFATTNTTVLADVKSGTLLLEKSRYNVTWSLKIPWPPAKDNMIGDNFRTSSERHIYHNFQ